MLDVFEWKIRNSWKFVKFVQF